MKNLFFTTGFILTTLFLFTKCSQVPNPEFNSKKVADFYEYGDAHNAAIHNLVLNYPEDSTSTSIEDCFDKIMIFNQNFAQLNWSAELVDAQKAKTLSEEFKMSSSLPYFYRRVTEPGSAWNMSELVQSLYQSTVITTEEKEILNDLISIINVSRNSGTSPNDLVIELERLVVMYDGLNFSKTSPKGDITGIVLAISLKSANYWALNQNVLLETGLTSNRVAPWVAADMAGALVGATVSAVREYASSGDVSLGNIGTGAVIGAVSSSTGLVGKVAKGITRFFGW